MFAIIASVQNFLDILQPWLIGGLPVAKARE